MGIADEPSLQSTVTAIYDVGCFFGALSTIWIGERFGRKNTIGTCDKQGSISRIEGVGDPRPRY